MRQSDLYHYLIGRMGPTVVLFDDSLKSDEGSTNPLITRIAAWLNTRLNYRKDKNR